MLYPFWRVCAHASAPAFTMRGSLRQLGGDPPAAARKSDSGWEPGAERQSDRSSSVPPPCSHQEAQQMWHIANATATADKTSLDFVPPADGDVAQLICASKSLISMEKIFKKTTAHQKKSTFCLIKQEVLVTRCIPVQNPSVTQQWVVNEECVVAPNRTHFFFFSPSLTPNPQTDSFRCRFSILNPRIPPPDEKTMRCSISPSNVFPIYCQASIPTMGCLQVFEGWHLQLWGRNRARLSSRVSDISVLGVQRWDHMVRRGAEMSSKKHLNALPGAEVAYNSQGSG